MATTKAKKPRKKRTDDHEFITVSAAAERMNICRTQVYKLMNDGELPYLDFGAHARRIRSEAVDDFIKARSKN